MTKKTCFYFTKWYSKIVFKFLEENIKTKYRLLEKTSIRLITTRSHRDFNQTCYNNNLLPSYTDIRIHDEAARTESFFQDFRKNLVSHEMSKQEIKMSDLITTCDQLKNEIRGVVSKVKYDALIIFLERIVSARQLSLDITHNNKLAKLYGSTMFMKKQPKSVINLSSFKLDEDIEDIFNLGMNCHLRTRYCNIRKKIEIEKLSSHITTEKNKSNISITDEEKLRCELKRFGLRKITDYTSDLITSKQRELIKTFNANDSIIVRKSDKSNTFVILNKSYYTQQLDDIISDTSKFEKLTKDPTEQLKKTLNNLIDIANNENEHFKLKKLVGHYRPGYLYGNPKIHKSLENPPLRPIISQIGTPMYEVAKSLNEILKVYLPTGNMITSTNEFLSIVQTIKQPGLLTSLDVESLFTNVPVQTTIEIIIQHAYHDPSSSPPLISEGIMRQLLLVCTTEAPFRHINGDIYRQTDGLSMGGPLAPLFANFYMSNLEEEILPLIPKEDAPIVYCRYVDDIFMYVKNIRTLDIMKAKFENNSVLSFTYEVEKNRGIAFLDVDVTRSRGGSVATKVHVKGTHAGDCMNYHSIAPERYKLGVIRTMLHRAYLICSDWVSLHDELNRLKQLFTNNNFPLATIEKEIKRFLERKIDNTVTNTNSTNIVKFYYQGQMSCQHKQEEDNLRKILDEHLTPSNSNEIQLSIYYRSKKLSQLFIKNNIHKDSDDSRCVYRYTCPIKERCQPSTTYLGHTTCTIKKRMTMHAQHGSIKEHHLEVHDNKITTADIIANIKVIYRSQERQDLYIAEALFIKDENPIINSQKEGENRILKIF